MHQSHSADHETTFCGVINDWTSSKTAEPSRGGEDEVEERERNKLAAAKCLNSRRKLTDQVQGETELEREQANLQTQVERLQKEIEKLVSHTPVCLQGCDSQPQAQPLPPFALTIHPMDNSTIAHPLGPPHAVKQEPQEEMLFSLHYH